MKKTWIALLLALCGGSVAFAASDTDRIKARLNQLAPEVKIDKITPVEPTGMFEVQSGRHIFYTDATGRYVFEGSLIDVERKVNLTEARVERLTRVDFSSLPLADAIVSVKGNGKRKLAIFSDPDCPYCRKLETQLAGVDNVTIYTFLFPIAQLHANATERAVSVWCSPDRVKAWGIAMKGGALPSLHCDTPVERNIALGTKLGVNGTPTLIFADGRRVPGAIPAAQIESLLN